MRGSPRGDSSGPSLHPQPITVILFFHTVLALPVAAASMEVHAGIWGEGSHSFIHSTSNDFRPVLTAYLSGSKHNLAKLHYTEVSIWTILSQKNIARPY